MFFVVVLLVILLFQPPSVPLFSLYYQLVVILWSFVWACSGGEFVKNFSGHPWHVWGWQQKIINLFIILLQHPSTEIWFCVTLKHIVNLEGRISIVFYPFRPLHGSHIFQVFVMSCFVRLNLYNFSCFRDKKPRTKKKHLKTKTHKMLESVVKKDEK